jgi:hypothetical protein
MLYVGTEGIGSHPAVQSDSQARAFPGNSILPTVLVVSGGTGRAAPLYVIPHVWQVGGRRFHSILILSPRLLPVSGVTDHSRTGRRALTAWP